VGWTQKKYPTPPLLHSSPVCHSPPAHLTALLVLEAAGVLFKSSSRRFWSDNPGLCPVVRKPAFSKVDYRLRRIIKYGRINSQVSVCTQSPIDAHKADEAKQKERQMKVSCQECLCLCAKSYTFSTSSFLIHHIIMVCSKSWRYVPCL